MEEHLSPVLATPGKHIFLADYTGEVHFPGVGYTGEFCHGMFCFVPSEGYTREAHPTGAGYNISSNNSNAKFFKNNFDEPKKSYLMEKMRGTVALKCSEFSFKKCEFIN